MWTFNRSALKKKISDFVINSIKRCVSSLNNQGSEFDKEKKDQALFCYNKFPSEKKYDVFNAISFIIFFFNKCYLQHRFHSCIPFMLI